jgi:hypothetical protein
MILGLCFRGTYKAQFLERELSEGTRSNGLESCGDDVSKENCDSSYPDVCIASPPPDLMCPIRISRSREMIRMDLIEILMA